MNPLDILTWVATGALALAHVRRRDAAVADALQQRPRLVHAHGKRVYWIFWTGMMAERLSS